MVTRENVMQVLKNVKDPEIGVSIVSLGMVKAVEVQGSIVHVDIALTIPDCPLRTRIRDDIIRSISEIEGVARVEVRLSSMSDQERVRVSQTLSNRPTAEQTNVQQTWRSRATGIERLPKGKIGQIMAISSGKGGVGKSLVTALLAVELRRHGFSVGILDADLTGASIAKIFGVKDHPIHTSTGIAPPASRAGVKLVSMNLLMDRDDAALVWRGPMINSAIRQLYSELEWGELDFLLVDLPPGCVSSDTRVYANGAPITVSQLKQGDHVYSVSSQILRDCKRNSLTAAVERRRVLEVVPQGESEVFEIRTKSRSLRATSNHPILAVNRRRLLGSRFYDYSLQWRRLGDLKPRDIIAVVKKLPESPRPMRRLPRVNVKTAKRIDMPGEVTDDFARLVGYFLGDGFVRIDPKTRTYQVLFAEPPEGRYRSHYIQLLRRIFGRIRVYQDSKHFGLLSRPAAELFRELDLFRHALEKRIPLWIFTLPISQKRAFIEGYCDADGCRRQGKPLFRREGWMNFESPNRLLMEDLRSLCITAGLRVTNLYSRVRTLRPPSGRTYTSKLWSFESSDQSRSSRYGAGLIRGEAGLGLVNDYVGFERVSRVARVGRQEVYDLKVDGNESFVADGIIVHNTSDAPLTVFQSLPLDAVLIVSSPQDLAVTIVAKAVNMAKIMNVPILGLIENMSYVTCPDCGRKIELFGSSKGQEASNAFSIEYLGSIPVNPLISQLCDEGKIEEYESPEFAGITQRLIEKTRQLNVPQTLRSTDKSMEKESGR